MCVSTGTGVVSAPFVISVTSANAPMDKCECATVTGTRLVRIGSVAVSGLAIGGPSSEYPVRGLTPSANTFPIVSVSTVGRASALNLKDVDVGWSDALGSSSLAVVAVSAARVTTEVFNPGRILAVAALVGITGTTSGVAPAVREC